MSAHTVKRPTPGRLAAGFAAGFLAVLVFSFGTIALYQAAGLAVPFPAWTMAPTEPFGVPQTFASAFFGGLWGLGYAVVEPWLSRAVGWLLGGTLYGALPLLALWFVVFPLKGIPVGAGFTAYGLQQGIVLHAAFGFGLALFFRGLTGAFAKPPAASAA